MITDIEWKDPTPPRQRNWHETLEQLKSRPGEWAQVAEYPTVGAAWTTVHRLRHNVLNVPTGVFEFRNEDNAVFARYLGDAEEGDAGKVKGALLTAPVMFGLNMGIVTHRGAA